MAFPHKYLVPQGMDEAMLVVETGFTPDQLDEFAEDLLQHIMIYKNVKEVAQNGGTYNG
jgi:hypothetical protein